ncbi:hypothetical protein MAMMFC1_00463 [Methylomusa anaerophila]|uniref:Uncharacterized protein n=1 Tax=Methylomusa anaerophila TaxID=1930071 RepID=A0A348AFI1_9FIRM|nr:hypothetical protein MAMMFC1_00463 [Methylomusa anaerophila]
MAAREEGLGDYYGLIGELDAARLQSFFCFTPPYVPFGIRRFNRISVLILSLIVLIVKISYPPNNLISQIICLRSGVSG